MSDFISIILHDGDRPAQSVTVHLSDSLRVLDDQISAKGQRLLFSNGSLLMPSFSFNYFNMHSGDHVFVVRPQDSHLNTKQIKKQKENWSGLSTTHNYRQYLNIVKNTQSSANKHLKLLGGSSLIHEAARLSDLEAEQLESKYSKYVHNMQTEDEQKQPEKSISETIIFPNENIRQPSSSALPILWGY